MKGRFTLFAFPILAVGVAAYLWFKPSEGIAPSATSVGTAAHPPAKGPTDPAIAKLLSTGSLGFPARLEAVAKIGKALDAVDRQLLLVAMRSPKPAEISDGEWYVLVNDAMQALRSQREPAPELTDALIALADDVKADLTLRDYALQHLREWYADLDPRTTQEDRPDKRAAIAQCLWNTAQDASRASAGTALLAWNEWTGTAVSNRHLEESAPSLPEKSQEWHARDAQPIPIESGTVSSADVDALAIRIASGDAGRAFRGTQATALQVCAQRHLIEVLPIARLLIQSPQTDTTLKLSAIAVVGQLGTADDAITLKQIQSSQHPSVLVTCIDAALRRLTAATPAH